MTTTFAELGLNEQILAGVDALGFTTPTPVQEQAIPVVLTGRDIVASAQTGTGKTAAFALPVLQLVADAKGKGPHALVVTPTRELAAQIEKVVSVVCEKTGQRAVIVMGGTKFDRQISELERGCDLLVATPGRLIDLMEHNHVSLAQVKVLVLDEADRMLDMGFWPSVRRIMHALPAKHQTLLFSATIPPSIKSTIDALLTDPATVEIARVGETADTVEEHLCPVTQGQKTELLRALLSTGGAAGEKPERVLVFCRTKHRVDDVSKTLKNAGVRVDVMHADRPQKARERALVQRDDPLLGALAEEGDLAPGKVDGAQLEPGGLGDARARRVEQLEEGPVPQVDRVVAGAGGDQRVRVRVAHRARERLGELGTRHGGDGCRGAAPLVEHPAVQPAQGREMAGHRRGRVARPGELGQVAPQLAMREREG